VISSFGAKAGGLRNDGINILLRKGTPVRAADHGVVAYTGNELRGFGNLILVRHGGGWVTAYAHTATISVNVGQTVRRGQVLARAGSSGGVGRPQLHFEIRRGRTAVDPLSHLSSG
jgi:murein DD-endopeptidase MepM/ murein hydrolase activator NlpD